MCPCESLPSVLAAPGLLAWKVTSTTWMRYWTTSCVSLWKENCLDFSLTHSHAVYFPQKVHFATADWCCMLKPYLLSLRLHQEEHNKDIKWVRARGLIVLSSSQRGLLSDRVMTSDSFLAKKQSYIQYIKKENTPRLLGYFHCFCLVPAVFSLFLEPKKIYTITEKINGKITKI